jgi:hypothetical protein
MFLGKGDRNMKSHFFALAFVAILIGACDGDFGVATDAGSDAQKADVRAGGDAFARDGLTSTDTSTATGPLTFSSTATSTVTGPLTFSSTATSTSTGSLTLSSTTTSTDGTLSIGTNLVTCEIPCRLADPQCGPYGRRPVASKYLMAEGELKCPDPAQTIRPVCTDPVGGFTGATGQYTQPGYSCCVHTTATATGSRKVVGLNCSLLTCTANGSCPWGSGGATAVCLLNAGTQSVKFIGWDCLI